MLNTLPCRLYRNLSQYLLLCVLCLHCAVGAATSHANEPPSKAALGPLEANLSAQWPHLSCPSALGRAPTLLNTINYQSQQMKSQAPTLAAMCWLTQEHCLN